MASSGIDYGGARPYEEKTVTLDPEKNGTNDHRRSSVTVSVKTVRDSTHRKLKPRHIQLIGIGGTIGTALYVQIGRGLMNGGPASLFLAFSIWYVVIRLCTYIYIYVYMPKHTCVRMCEAELCNFTGALSSSPSHYVSSFFSISHMRHPHTDLPTYRPTTKKIPCTTIHPQRKNLLSKPK